MRDVSTSIRGPAGGFPATRPSLLASATSHDAAVRHDAFEAIIAVYWKPIYTYIRLRWRKSTEDAQDLTQAFLAELLVAETIARFDPSRASFRTYVRICVDGFVGHDEQAAGRLKRGGGQRAISIDDADGAAEAQLPPVPAPEMEDLFHREWQRQMLTLGVHDLRRFAEGINKTLPLRIFEAHDLVDEPPSYAELARRFEVSESTVTNHLAWARRELRRLVLARVAAVTAGPDEFIAEARSLFT